MPQMAPLSWFSLMIMFILLMIMINTMLYFNKKYIIKMEKNKKMNKSMLWKW
uniref:ATP synthase complex subunit 8 n=1 Tax=Ventidius malayensis TaxID=3095942 RepID=A0AB38Z6B4_9HEMI|nr:ATP synthase F0 subunit 8 [Ventidius malayensis]WPW46908.1 ATP synthase F0 subunit 8 [Ventidius malayensis]